MLFVYYSYEVASSRPWTAELFGKEGTSDPMVTFKLKDKQLESTVKNKQLAHEWLESFELRADDPDYSDRRSPVDDWDQLSGRLHGQVFYRCERVEK